jgi:hypothetical protein
MKRTIAYLITSLTIELIMVSTTLPVYASDISVISVSPRNSFTADYTCDGTADNIEFQKAIDALPSS